MFVSGLCFLWAESGFLFGRRNDFMKNTVIVKDKDEWSALAEFIGNIVAKYADVIDFDSLPDPDMYLLKRDMLDAYKSYIRESKKKIYFSIEYALVA